ncbi:MAG: protein kinase, partial [bacterium]|nr:protein kinase [bacterium]
MTNREVDSSASTEELLPSSQALSPGTTFLDGRFEIEERLGSGGMGAVYKAKDHELNKTVALKFRHPDADRDLFLAEAGKAQEIHHSNVCRIHDIHDDEDNEFISMEYLEDDLARVLDRDGPRSPEKTVAIGLELCAGLEAIHKRKLFHQDLKPANIMIDEKGQAKISDLGLAGHRCLGYTRQYMAPEQGKFYEVSIKSDIFSLGLVLYEMLTGHQAFEHSCLVDPPPPPPSAWTKGVNPALERVVLGCMETDPQRRPSSATEVANALGALRGRSTLRKIHVVYPCEDRSDVRDLVRWCRKSRIDTSWDQDWEPWDDDHRRGKAPLSDADVVALYGSASLPHDRFVRNAYQQAVADDWRIVLLHHRGMDSPDFEHAESIPFDPAGGPSAAAEGLIEYLGPEATLPVTSPRSDDARALLTEALQANQWIPTDTITERIFVTSKAAELTQRAFHASRGARVPDEVRFRSDLEYARLLRFRGEWAKAEQFLGACVTGAQAARTLDPDLFHLLRLEQGSLQFERGLIYEGIEKVEKVLDHFESKGQIDHNLIKALRQLGNMVVEQGEWDRAKDLLSSAVSLARVLESSRRRQGKPDRAATLLWIDCVRELGSFVLRQEQVDEGLEHFHRALAEAEAEALHAVGHHLAGVLCYHLGRAHYLHTGDLRKADEFLQRSLDILERYDNPVRVAFVYEHIARVRTKLPPSADEAGVRAYFERALRIREKCGHRYMTAKTRLGLGDFHFREGDLDRALEEYREAHRIFAQYGKKPEQAHALYCLGSTYAYRRDLKPATEYLTQAEDRFQELGLSNRLREVRFELLKIAKPRLFEGTYETVLARGRAKKYDFSVNEIGEYAVHGFIKELISRNSMERGGARGAFADVELGIGDDAAVIRISGAAKFDLVLTTDAAPGSICRSPDVNKGKYAARFSVIHSLSDLLAMGATPVAVLLNMYLARDAKFEYAMRVVETVGNEAELYNVPLIGGDIKERREQSIGCVGAGLVPRGRAIRRSGARPGHVVAITQAAMESGSGTVPRRIGKRWAQEVLEIRKLTEDSDLSGFCRDDWKEKLLFLPYEEMLRAAKTGKVRSAIDTSDGVLGCLQLLGKESGVSFVLRQDLVEKVIDPEVRTVAEHLGLPPAQFLFNAGHDWEIVLT